MNILVLCTGNSARSILAEALFNHMGQGRVHAYSAGSKPAGKVNPFALSALEANGIATGGFRSKSWDEFAEDGAPEMDVVLTVCGNAAGETCPVWIGAPITVHWGFPDPAAAVGSDDEIAAAFAETYTGLCRNIEAFMALDFETLSKSDIQSAMIAIHQNV